jgi:hypothetical protein
MVGDRLGDVVAVLPKPAAIFAASHATGSAAMAGTLTSQRLSITLLSSNGKVRFEEFVSHYSQWVANHSILLSVKPTKAVLQEWLHAQIASVPALVTAKQADVNMDNPDSERMLTLLHRQRDNLRERQSNRAA